MITLKARKAGMPKNAGVLLRKFNLEKGGMVQYRINKAVIDNGLPYCPWRTGNLAKSPYRSLSGDKGEVIYDVPYAKKVYYGTINGRPIRYSTYVNHLAGPFWVERMKADRMDNIVQEAKHAAGIK